MINRFSVFYDFIHGFRRLGDVYDSYISLLKLDASHPGTKSFWRMINGYFLRYNYKKEEHGHINH